MTDDELIARYIELNPHKPGSAEARLKQYGIPVWAIIGYLPVYEHLDEIARGYDVPRVMVDAAVAYYHRHKGAIDASIEANNAPLDAPVARSAWLSSTPITTSGSTPSWRCER
jgi:uncharacterized protein (DUF433 family)